MPVWCQDRCIGAATITIPTELRRPHRLVAATREATTGLTPREDGRLEVRPREGVAHLVVTREQLRRALLVLHAIAAEAQRRGFDFAAIDKDGYGHRAGVGVVIRGHTYTVEITEELDRVALSESELAAWHERNNRHRFAWEKEAKPPNTKGVPTGRLRVSLPSRWHGARSNWLEGRKPLEAQLPLLFDELERRAAEDDHRAEERARQQAELQRQEEQRFERELRERIENTRVSRLSAEITSWRLAQETRAYIAALRQRLAALEPEERERIAAWCDWADSWSRRGDPTINTRRIRGVDDERDRFSYPRSQSAPQPDQVASRSRHRWP